MLQWVWTYQYFSVLRRLFAAANLYLSVLLQNIHGVSLYHSALLQKFEFVPLCTSYFCRLLYLSVLLTSADFLYLSVLLQTITAMSLHFMPRHLFVGKYSLRSLCIFHKLITQVWCQTAAFANNGCSQSVFLHFWTIFLPDWSVFKNKKWRESAQAASLHICAFCLLAIWVSKTFLSSLSQIRHEPKGAKNWLWRWWWLSPVTFLHCCDTVGGSVALEDIINLTRLLHWACKIIFVYIFSHSRCFRFKKLKSVLHQNCYSRIKPWHNPGSSYPWKSRRPLSGAEDNTNSHCHRNIRTVQIIKVMYMDGGKLASGQIETVPPSPHLLG